MTDRQRGARVRVALSAWYRRNGRDLPWRNTRDPYAIWVSEVMLQQTRVGAVAPYYRRFLQRFPDVHVLARARLQSVLKAWEGMGYYSRARNLHRAARLVVSRFGGQLPRSPEELMGLPGIGRYTAGAIASIAFGLDEPVLDGNVTRVLARLFRIRANPKEAVVQRKLWGLARQMIPPGKAGLVNQAMMDLGAVVCVPRVPRCPACPVRRYCLALARGEQSALPHKDKPRPLPHETVVAGVIWKGNRILIDQRKPRGLLGGLWEFPGGKVKRGERLTDALVREVREELGVEVEVVGRLVRVNHAYTHFRITLHVFECRYVSGAPRAIGCAACKWVRAGDLGRYPFPKANHRIVEMLRGGGG